MLAEQGETFFGRVGRDDLDGHVLARRLDQGYDTAIVVDYQQTGHFVLSPRCFALAFPPPYAGGHCAIKIYSSRLNCGVTRWFGKPQPYTSSPFRPAALRPLTMAEAESGVTGQTDESRLPAGGSDDISLAFNSLS